MVEKASGSAVYPSSRMLPFLARTPSGLEVLVEAEITSFLGDNTWSCTDLSNGETLEIPKEDAELLVRPTEGDLGGVLRLVLANRWLDMRGGGFSMALRANVRFLPFQIRPLLKFNTTAERRLLIADETGLGKTIEAGMIIAETLALEGDEATIVVLSPRAVMWKWERELRRKFGIRAQVDTPISDFEGYRPPVGVHIVSHGSGPSKDTLDIRHRDVDLLIIDEIHRFIGRDGTQKRRGRAMSLSKSSSGVVGMSATPVQLEEEDLRAILELIAPGSYESGGFPDDAALQRCINRTLSSIERGEPVWPGDLERLLPHLSEGISESLRKDVLGTDERFSVCRELVSAGPIGKRMTRARARDPDVSEAIGKVIERRVESHIIERGPNSTLISEIDTFLKNNGGHNNRQQLASCPGAAVRILGRFCGEEDAGDGSDWDDDPDDLEIGDTGEARRLRDRARNQMPNIGPKISSLQRLLMELSQREDVTKVVVFTHWLPTLMHVKSALSVITDFDLHIIGSKDDGKVSQMKMDRFRSSNDFGVLFVSDRMSVGVDLEMANVIINMDLPYNPAVLQQRIGRLDRSVIQKSSFIEVHNLVLKDSVEEDILEVLRERTDVFRGVIGGMEAVCDPDEPPPKTDREASDILAKLSHKADVTELAESDILLKVLDSSLDGEIGEIRRSQHPLYSREHLILSAAIQNLGGKATWDEEGGELSIHLTPVLRKILLDSKHFLPWDIDEFRARFFLEDKDGLRIKMRGQDSILGPFHPFISSCVNLLLYSEGVAGDNLKGPCSMLVGTTGTPRWRIVNTSEELEMDSQVLVSSLENFDLVLGSWSLYTTSVGHREIRAEVIRNE